MATDLTRVKTYYDETFKDWGHSVDALSWEDKKKQWLRFQVLSTVIPDEPCSLLDVGCGFGDLQQFLTEQKFSQVTYTGIDVMKPFIDIARKRFPNGNFIEGDFHTLQQDFDVVLASGPFSLKEADNEAMIRRAIDALWRRTRKALAFNLLSNKASERLRFDDYYFYDPAAMLAYARTLTPKVQLREDYLQVEFALFMER